MQPNRRLRWNVVVPVGLVALALAAVVWLDVTKGGEATPAAPLGAIGTPVRGAYIAPTATPVGFVPTPQPRPTIAGTTEGGNPLVRDEKRKSDLLLLLDAAGRVKARDGSYPTTKGNVQTLCNYKEIDVGCKIQAEAGGDTVADPAKVGYWYSSDGQSARFYASLEGAIPKEQGCQTNDAELKKHDNVICVKTP